MSKRKKKKIKFIYKAKIGTRARIKTNCQAQLRRRFGSSNKSLLNRRVKKIIYAALKMGLPLRRCSDLVGVSVNTLGVWMEYGKDSRRKKFHDFRNKVLRIRIQRELDALKIIKQCGQGSFMKTDTVIKNGPKGIETITKTTRMYPQWQAEAWFLERRHKKSYGKEVVYDSGSPDEQARKIKEAYDALSNSIPKESTN